MTRRLVRGGTLLPVAALIVVRALTRLHLIADGPLDRWPVLLVGFTLWLAGEWALRRPWALRGQDEGHDAVAADPR